MFSRELKGSNNPNAKIPATNYIITSLYTFRVRVVCPLAPEDKKVVSNSTVLTSTGPITGGLRNCRSLPRAKKIKMYKFSPTVARS